MPMESKSTSSTKPATEKTSAIKRLHIYYRWLRLMSTKENLYGYIQRRWKLLSILALYVFFRPAFEGKLASLLESFESSWGSFIIWLILIYSLMTPTFHHNTPLRSKIHPLCKRCPKTLVIILLGGWFYYRFIGASDYIPTSTPIPWICYIDIFLVICISLSITKHKSYKEEKKELQSIKENYRKSCTERKQNGYLIDQPIVAKDEDLLGRRDKANALADRIFHTNTSETAFTLGLTAPWGAGKTSFMLAMEEHLKEQHGTTIILWKFNPWLHRKAPNLTQVFFEELSNTLNPYNSDLACNFIHYVNSILAKEDNMWVQLSTLLLPQSFKAKSVGEQYESLKQEIRQLRRKIFVFIDDVDRLDGEELTELFSLVRNISSFPNMSYILAYDKKYVLLQLEKKGLNKELAVNYMEKIMQVEFPLAEITSEQIEKAFSDVVEQSAEEYPNLKEAIRSSNIELRSHLPTLRSIKQIQNILSSFPKKLKGNVIPFDWFIIELIRTQYPLLFSFLKENYTLIFDDRGDGKLFIKTQEDETGRIDLPAKIKELIPINKSEQVLELMMSLWGEDRENGHGQANNWEYIGIYFYRVLDNNDIRMAELKQYLAKQASEQPQSFENFKSYVDQMLNSSRWLTFCDLVYGQYGNSLNEVVNILCLAFYMLSREERRWLQNVSEQIDKCIDSIREYEGEEAQKQRLKELFDYPDIRKGVLLYISSVVNRVEQITIPFTQNELEGIKENLFLEYVKEEKPDKISIDPIDCYRLWLQSQTYIRVEPDGRRIRQVDPEKNSSMMNARMKEIIEKNIGQLMPYFIQSPRDEGSQPKHYRLYLPYPIWTLDKTEKEIDYFESFISGLSDISPSVKEEFQRFLEKWLRYIDILGAYLDNPKDEDLYKELSLHDQLWADDWLSNHPEYHQGLQHDNKPFFQMLRSTPPRALGFIPFTFNNFQPKDLWDVSTSKEDSPIRL